MIIKPNVIITFIVMMAVVFSGCAEKKKSGGAGEGLTGGTRVYSDDFERTTTGEDWVNSSGKWKIVDGWLHARGDRNGGFWLDFPLPPKVRIEFDARSDSPDGDLKVEVFNAEQRHETGYILILGGWENSVSIIARQDEHGEDRLEVDAKVIIGSTHHFTIVRTDGALRWYVDGKPMLTYHDTNPLKGVYMGFNNWDSDAYYDNIEIFQL